MSSSASEGLPPAAEPEPAPPRESAGEGARIALGLLLLGVVAGALDAAELGARLHWRITLSPSGRVVLGAVAISRALALLTPALALLWAARRARRPALARWGASLAGGLCLALGLIDARFWAITGNRLSDYLPLLAGREPMQWAGKGAGLAFASLGAVGAAVALASAGALVWLARRGPAALAGPGARRATGAAWLTLLLLPPLLAARQPPSQAARLDLALGASPLRLVPLGGGPQTAFSAALSTDLDRLVPRLAARGRACVTPPAAPPRGRPRDVVIVVLESLRRGSFSDPALTPRIAAWCETSGRRATWHRSNSNCSYLGVFSLLYGASPLVYPQTLAAELPSPLCEELRQLGYRRLLFSSSSFAWERMDQYVGPQNFDEQRIETAGEWPARDAAVLGALRERLAERERPPVFAFAFLMSTHFDYAYPRRYGTRQPAQAALDWMALRGSGEPSPAERQVWLNRYANTLAWVDDLLGELLESLDPERTSLIVTGDHGESFYEDGAWLHSSRISDQQTGVPLLAGGSARDARWDLATSHLDVAPTLLHAALGRPSTNPHLDGRDLLRDEVGPSVFELAGDHEDFVLYAPHGRLRLSARRGRLLPMGEVDEVDDYLPTPGQIGPWREVVAERFRDLDCGCR